MALLNSHAVRGCPVCGQPRGACTSRGRSTDPDSTIRVIEEDPAMAEEKKNLGVYDVEQNGTTATFQMTEEDAKRMPGAKKRGSSSAPAPGTDPSGKARTAPNKGA